MARYNRLCQNCGTRIPDERRAALPETRVCVRCSEAGVGAPRLHDADDTPLDAFDNEDAVESAQGTMWN